MFSLYTLAYAILLLGGTVGLVVAARRLETETERPRRERMRWGRFLLVLALGALAAWLTRGWILHLAQRALLDFWILLPLLAVYGLLGWLLCKRAPRA